MNFKVWFAAVLMIVAAAAAADYTIKDGNGVSINVASEVIGTTHVPIVVQKLSAGPNSGLAETLDFTFSEETITSVTDNIGSVEFEPEVNSGLLLFTDVGGMTSLNGYWHSADGITVPAIANAEYTTGGEIIVIPTVDVKQDTIIDQVQLQVEDGGATASILGANTAASIEVYAYNPGWPGEKITLLNYTNPNSIYKHLGTISQSVINSKIYQTFTISDPKFVPSGWMIAAETPQSYSLDLSVVNISGRYASAPLVLDPGFFDERVINRPAVNSSAPNGVEILTNETLDGVVDNEEVPDWADDSTLDGQLYEVDDKLVVRPTSEAIAVLTQAVTLTEGSDYVLQINCKGSEIVFGLQGPTGFFAKTTRTTEEEYFHMTFTATSDEYTVIIGFPRPNGFYIVDSIQLWEV